MMATDDGETPSQLKSLSQPHEQMPSPIRSPLEESLFREPSKENMTPRTAEVPARKPLPRLPTDSSTRVQGSPLSSVHVNNASDNRHPHASSVEIETYIPNNYHSRSTSQEDHDSQPVPSHRSYSQSPHLQSLPYRQQNSAGPLEDAYQAQASKQSPKGGGRSESPRIVTPKSGGPSLRPTSEGSSEDVSRSSEMSSQLQYHHQKTLSRGSGVRLVDNRGSRIPLRSSNSDSPLPYSFGDNATPHQHLAPNGSSFMGAAVPRPSSAYSSTSEFGMRGRTRSPQLSPNQYSRGASAQSRRSPESRPISYIDLLNVPYPQPPPAPTSFDNNQLRTAVGSNASLLSTMRTLEMYRANVKKTNDPAIQYEFAVFMINAAQEAAASGLDESVQRQASPSPGRDVDGAGVDNSTNTVSHAELLWEARHILQRLSDRSYPFAQYYLADGYASGLLNKGKEDNDRAFPLFVAASKHGHAEAGYRAALCYEFGWGARKDPHKAVQFYRQSASKNHPGAMSRLARACLDGDMGLGNRYREGLKWLKRAAESADFQYNSAPYELGLLHETGYGDDVFQDESYAAQLFTQSADLGHVEANYRLGDAYEHGKLNCPKDPALSVHFYTGAAQRGHPVAMMALCAWYMVGAEPVLEKDENEAYEWARKAAECGKQNFSAPFSSL